MGFFSSIFGTKKLKKANANATIASQKANDLAMGEYDQYRDFGNEGLKAYRDAIGIGDSNAAITNFQNSPLFRLQYDAALKSGQTGTANMGNAAGMRNSGRTLMALQDNARNITNQTFGQYVNPLAGTSNVGLDIAGRRSDLQQNLGQINSNYYTNKGQIQAGQMAGFDSLLGDAFKFGGKFVGM
jgi:hypothetical protein